MKDKKVLFMGSPSFSIPVLKMLIENTNVIGVVTQPDKPVGRKKILTASPVKQFAIENNIEVFSPAKLNEEKEKLYKFKPDIIITCAYGQMISEDIINYPEYKIVNVHASLLPKYRGGAPINRAIMSGETKTGITIMFTDKNMDSGPIIKQESINIDINDNYDIVSEKLSNLGAKLLKETLPSIFDKTCEIVNQNENEVSFAKIIKREDEHIDFNDKSINVHNKIRGLSSTPGGYSTLGDLNIKIYKSLLEETKTNAKPGTIIKTDKEAIYVACQDKEIKILEIGVPGKKRMLIKDYLNGKKDLIGKIFK